MRFGQPWFLLLLLGLPFFPLLARWSRSGLEKGRSIAGTVLRVLLFAALVSSLADAQWVSRSYRTATIFLLDHSHSIPQDFQKKAFDWVQEQLKKLPKDDAAGVILFGGEAMIEVPVGPQPALTGPHSVVSRAATDIGAAIRLALAVFPQGYQRRIVLVSDGNENKGHALAEAEAARVHGAAVDVFPLRYDYPNEVWVEGLHVPSDIVPKEPYEATVVVNSQREGPASLAIYRNGQLLSLQKVRLNKGKNIFTVSQKIEAAGTYAYEAVVEMPGDTVSQNNVAHAFAKARGESRVAVVAGEPVDGETLVAGLREEGVDVTLFGPSDLVGGRVDASAYDCVVFSNVDASQVDRGVMQAVEAVVHDTGVGFVMVGGERSYGPGGYRGTPFEELLPVTMEQPQRRVLPNGALCLVLHTCEIPEGNFWAKQIGQAALKVLNPKDYMGVLLYGGSGEEWLFEMQLVQDKKKLGALIDKAMPGDMPSFDATMKLAHEGLRKVNAASRHVVIISDADPSGPTRALVDAMVQDRITITTVAIFPHGGSDLDKMAAVASVGRGRFYNVTDPGKLPQIFIKEAATLQRSMVIEGRIPPTVLGHSEAIKGIAPGEFPPLYGYTLTNPKPLSRLVLGAPVEKTQGEDGPGAFDPLLAEWLYGLGRTMAFTSDAKARWAKDWVGWEKYRKFWSQTVRSALRTVPRSPYAVQADVEGGKGKVTVDAHDDQGKYVHTLKFSGSVTSPQGQKLDLSFRQTGPGRYEAEFEAGEVGVYRIAGSFEGAQGEKGYLSQGVSLSYAAEYRDLKTNLALLSRIQETTGGRRLSADTPVYAPLARATGIAMPLWPWLLAFVLALFPFDVFIRRVAVDWGRVLRRALASVRRRRAAPEPPAMPETLQALAKKKQEVRAVQLGPVSGPVDLEGGGAPPPPAGPSTAAAPPPGAKPAPAAPPAESEYLKRLLDAKKKARKDQ